MKIVNQQIYSSARWLSSFLTSTAPIPVRINFYLQKNIRIIQQAADEIEAARMQIVSQYGILNEEKTGYNIPAEEIEQVTKELNDLFSLEQDLPIHAFKLEDFDGIELTYQQMSAIIFMIEE